MKLWQRFAFALLNLYNFATHLPCLWPTGVSNFKCNVTVFVFQNHFCENFQLSCKSVGNLHFFCNLQPAAHNMQAKTLSTKHFLDKHTLLHMHLHSLSLSLPTSLFLSFYIYISFPLTLNCLPGYKITN